MKKVLVTAIGGDIAQSVAILLKKYFPKFQVIGCDSKNLTVSKLLISGFFNVPEAKNDKYISELNNLINSEKVDCVIPMNEFELNKIIENINLIPKDKFIMSSKYAVEVGTDKFFTFKKLQEIGIEMPWTVLAEKEMPIEIPCIVKLRKSSGSKDVNIITNKKEALRYKKKEGYIFQELLEPSDMEVTCAVFRNSSGIVKHIAMLRKLTKGYTSWAKVIHSENIKNICEIIATELEVIGSINIQLIITDKGPKVFEINPRFSSTVLMRDIINFQDLKWTIHEFLGEYYRFKDINKDAILLKKSLSDIEVS